MRAYARLTTESKGAEVNLADRHCVVHFMTVLGLKEEKQWVPLPGKPWVRDPKVAIGQELRYQLQETASEESESEGHVRKIEWRYGRSNEWSTERRIEA